MKVLSLEESKKIAVKFLKHIGRYYPEKTDQFFNIKKRWLIIQLPIFIIGKKSIYNCLWYPQNKKEKPIQNYFESYLAFNIKVLSSSNFYWAIRNSLNKERYNYLYAAADSWVKKRDYDKSLICLNIDELSKEAVPIQSSLDTYIFTSNIKFCFIITHENFVLIFATKDIIKNFKMYFKKYRSYLYHENMFWGFPIEK